MSQLTVRRVESPSDLRAFVRLPWSIYTDDPNWVPPLLAEITDRLSPQKNPYFQHAEAALFIAWRDGQPVGRISAQVCQLVQAHQRQGDGQFGFFECQDFADSEAITASLFGTAEAWLRGQGMTRMLGPFSFSINEDSGLLVDGFHRPPHVFMGHNLANYERLFAAVGLTKQIDLYAYHMNINDPYSERLTRVTRFATQDKRVTLRTVDKHRIGPQLDVLREIFNEAWSDNWGYVPMTDAEIESLATIVKRLLGNDAVLVAEVDGEAAGFIVVIPNLNEWTADLDGRLCPLGWLRLLYRIKFTACQSVRVPLMGIRKKYQGTRTGASIVFAMLDRCRQTCIRKGVQHCEMSWILETNTAMHGILDTTGATRDKTYRIFSKWL